MLPIRHHGYAGGLPQMFRSNLNNNVLSNSGPYEGEDTLNAAYWRSPCSTLREQFVGRDPLFPPCNHSVPEGIAKWGKYPYVVSMLSWDKYPYVVSMVL